MIIGGYTLHLYCDLTGCQRHGEDRQPDASYKPAEFYAQTYWKAKKEAQKVGWKFFNSRTGEPPTIHCPECSGRKSA